MKIVKVPGVNGLGMTSGVVTGADELVPESEGIELNLEDISEQVEQIYKGSKRYLNSGNVLFVGGDHSISYPIGKAFLENSENPCIVVFDAHADCMPTLKEPTHEEWLRGIVDEGLEGGRVLLIGSRKVEDVEVDYMDEKGVKRVSVQQVRDNFEDVLDKIREHVSGREVYVSVDIDALDSGLIKATGYPVENGLSKEELMDMLNVCNEGDVVCADLVEYNPWKDESGKEKEVLKEIINLFIS